MSTIVVALVLFSSSSQKYLIVRRGENQSGAGFWEFPGGKVEVGESAEQALQREIKEELGLSIDPAKLDFLSQNTHQYGLKCIEISFYYYEILQEVPLVLVDHDHFAWCDVQDLLNFNVADADRPVIHQLMETRRRR